jgi:hypothetical protein
LERIGFSVRLSALPGFSSVGVRTFVFRKFVFRSASDVR